MDRKKNYEEERGDSRHPHRLRLIHAVMIDQPVTDKRLIFKRTSTRFRLQVQANKGLRRPGGGELEEREAGAPEQHEGKHPSYALS